MKPHRFKECNMTLAEDQPEYQQLPCHAARDSQGRMVICWKLPWRDRLVLLLTGKLWQEVLTFNKPLSPQYLSTEKPIMRHDGS